MDSNALLAAMQGGGQMPPQPMPQQPQQAQLDPMQVQAIAQALAQAGDTQSAQSVMALLGGQATPGTEGSF